MIRISGLAVQTGQFKLVVDSLVLPDDAWCIISGPSGSGKTLLLETIAGFYQPQSGMIILDGKDISHLPPEKRGIGIVFQDYALFPHMTVNQNIGYGPAVRHLPGIEQIVRDMAGKLGIERLLDRYPATLSGGEKQRVAIARALVVQPGLLLLDEPASALDPAARQELWRDLSTLFGKGGLTIIHVTHDQNESETLGTHIILLKNGTIMKTSKKTDFER